MSPKACDLQVLRFQLVAKSSYVLEMKPFGFPWSLEEGRHRRDVNQTTNGCHRLFLRHRRDVETTNQGNSKEPMRAHLCDVHGDVLLFSTNEVWRTHRENIFTFSIDVLKLVLLRHNAISSVWCISAVLFHLIEVKPTPVWLRDADWPSPICPSPTVPGDEHNRLRGTKGVPWYNGIYNAWNTPK